MLTIINGTNRPQNLSQVFAKECFSLVKNSFPDEKIAYYSMEDLPVDYLQNNLYGKRSEDVQKLIDSAIIPSTKFLFVIPEYNGSYPGILKLWIDSLSPSFFRGKKAAILGVSDGRAGNLMGIDHLTVTLNHIGITTLPLRQPIAGISKLIVDAKIQDEATQKLLTTFVERIVKF